jgi:hypothetical protein
MPNFEVRVGVNLDGYEVYRIRAATLEDAVAKAHAVPGGDDDPELLRQEEMSSLTTNWREVSAHDVKLVPPVTVPKDLQEAMAMGFVAVDADGPVVMLFNPRTNHVGWTSYEWSELTPESRARAQKAWDASFYSMADVAMYLDKSLLSMIPVTDVAKKWFARLPTEVIVPAIESRGRCESVTGHMNGGTLEGDARDAFRYRAMFADAKLTVQEFCPR